MDNKVVYYKLVKNLDVNLRPYKVLPMYDEHPDMGSYQSTLGVAHPQKGDYLIYENGNIRFSSVERDFFGVSFTFKVTLEELLKKGIICEINLKVYNSDIELTSSIKEINKDIYHLTFALECMKDNKEEYDEADIIEAQSKILDLEEQLKILHDKARELF